MTSPSSRTIEVPITSNFRERLSVLEFYMSIHGSRKGLADTALRTADSGYLTRCLVDAAQQVVITEEDCGTNECVEAKVFTDGNGAIEELRDQIESHYSFEDIYDPKTKNLIVGANEMIHDEEADRIIVYGVEKVKIRIVLDYKSEHGICAHCYGRDLAANDEVGVGGAVGIIAVRSVGEPGTQLTMRTLHTGGVAAAADITRGLPRVEELFEACRPRGLAVITEIDGTVSLSENDYKRGAIVAPENGESQSYNIVYGARIKAKEGDHVGAGDELTRGSVYSQDLLGVKKPKGVQEYLAKEVQKVYRLQGVDINDKHIGVIVRQMLGKIKIVGSGDTDLLPGSLVGTVDFYEKDEEARKEGLEETTRDITLLGITKASLATESLLPAASFQETTRVLTGAAIKGRQDCLRGLKGNTIIDQLIPAGTGVRNNEHVYLKEQDQRSQEDISLLEDKEDTEVVDKTI